jgi:hypothetical protein
MIDILGNTGDVAYAPESRACNNIFYIKDGAVTQYSPIGTGGARCYTDETDRPGFVGAANIQ